MPIQPKTRLVTGKSAIPEGQPQAGSVTGEVKLDKFYLRGVGTSFLSIVPVRSYHQFIFIPAFDYLGRIISITDDLLMLMDEDTTGITAAGDAWQYVNGNLTSYSITPQAAGAFKFNGTTLASGTPAINQFMDSYNNTYRLQRAAWVDGMGTSLLITENL